MLHVFIFFSPPLRDAYTLCLEPYNSRPVRRDVDCDFMHAQVGIDLVSHAADMLDDDRGLRGKLYRCGSLPQYSEGRFKSLDLRPG